MDRKKNKASLKKASLQLIQDEKEYCKDEDESGEYEEEDVGSKPYVAKVEDEKEDDLTNVALDSLEYKDAHLAFDPEKSPKFDN